MFLVTMLKFVSIEISLTNRSQIHESYVRAEQRGITNLIKSFPFMIRAEVIAQLPNTSCATVMTSV